MPQAKSQQVATSLIQANRLRHSTVASQPSDMSLTLTPGMIGDFCRQAWCSKMISLHVIERFVIFERRPSNSFSEQEERLWTVKRDHDEYEIVDESRLDDLRNIRKWSRTLGLKEEFPLDWLERKKHLRPLEALMHTAGKSVLSKS